MVIGIMNCIDAGVLVIDITLIAYLDLSKLDSDLTINWKFVYRMDEGPGPWAWSQIFKVSPLSKDRDKNLFFAISEEDGVVTRRKPDLSGV